MNSLVTIEPDFETPWSDGVREYSRNHPISKEKRQKYKAMCRGNATLDINPKWKLCFSGR